MREGSRREASARRPMHLGDCRHIRRLEGLGQLSLFVGRRNVMTHTSIDVGQHICGEIAAGCAPFRGSGRDITRLDKSADLHDVVLRFKRGDWK